MTATNKPKAFNSLAEAMAELTRRELGRSHRSEVRRPGSAAQQRRGTCAPQTATLRGDLHPPGPGRVVVANDAPVSLPAWLLPLRSSRV
jgi:hypothetical protein